MTIKTQCTECGKRYSFRDEHASRKFNCKTCGSANRVPTTESQPSDDDFSSYLDDAVDMEAESSQMALPRPRKKTGKSSRNGKRQTMPGEFPYGLTKNQVVIGTAIIGSLAIMGPLVIMGLYRPIQGLLMVRAVLAITNLAGTVSVVWLWILAFKEETVCGLLFLFPLYILYYVVSRWEEGDVRVPGSVLVGTIVANLSVYVYALMILEAIKSGTAA